jgi:hypothetical protein
VPLTKEYLAIEPEVLLVAERTYKISKAVPLFPEEIK